MKYDKKHASLDEQIERLQKRGMLIKDVEVAKQKLLTIGYYRLSSYWYRFEMPPQNGHRTHIFKPGVTFEDVFNVYVFDQRLRILVLEAIERLEISMRAVWADAMSEKYGPHALLQSVLFDNKDEYYKSVANIIHQTARARNTSAEILHYLNSYGDPLCPPIWIATSVMSFGELQRWIMNTAVTPVKAKVAKAFNLPNIDSMIGTFRSLATVRNKCAHHARIWDCNLKTRMPLMSKNFEAPMVTFSQLDREVADSRMYNYLLVLGHIMQVLNDDSSWPHRVASLVRSSLSSEQQLIMGFPKGWEKYAFWGLSAK